MITVNGVKIEPTIFPDKTSQVWKLPTEILQATPVNIDWHFESEAEFLHLAQLTWLLRKSWSNRQINLYLDYLPYARQDHSIRNDATFALHIFAGMLENLPFNRITILDPHSSQIKTNVDKNNLVFEYPYRALAEAIVNTKPDFLCYPDAGALKKYQDLYDIFKIPHIYGEKDRDSTTGEIKQYSLILSSQQIKGKTILIVDDICDGGATFVHLSKALYEAGAGSVHLFVTHGLFTKGYQPLIAAKIISAYDKTGERFNETKPQ